MSVRTSLPILSVLVLLAFAGVAQAGDYRQVWRDSEGQIVHNSFGTCVRSMWITDEDACAHEPHTFISQEDRTVYFAFNKASLDDEAKARLDSLASELNSADDIKGADIVGFADRIGTIRYNEMLSKKRAETVRSYLIAQGLIKPSETETRWVGKSEPTADCPDNLSHAQLVDCLQPDRKVTVEIGYASDEDKADPAQ